MSWLTSLISPIIDGIKQLTKSKVSLKIESLFLHPRRAGEIKGYVGRVRVTNKGKKIAYNLTANIDVERDGIYSEVFVVTTVAGGRVTHEGKVIATVDEKEPAHSIEYKWMDEKKRLFGDTWEKLRQGDVVYLVFPKKRHIHVGFGRAGKGISYETHTLDFLKLWAGVNHRATVTVKGETSEKDTVSAKRTFKFNVGDEDDAKSIFVR